MPRGIIRSAFQIWVMLTKWVWLRNISSAHTEDLAALRRLCRGLCPSFLHLFLTRFVSKDKGSSLLHVFLSQLFEKWVVPFFFSHQTVSKLLFVSYVSMLIVAMSAFDPVVRARTGGLLPPINVPVEYEMDFKQFSTTCCSHFDIMRPRWDEANECHHPQMFTFCFEWDEIKVKYRDDQSIN